MTYNTFAPNMDTVNALNHSSYRESEPFQRLLVTYVWIYTASYTSNANLYYE